MKFITGAASAIFVLQAAAASAATVTFDFTGGIGETPSAEFSAGGVDLTVSALSVDDAGEVRADSDSVVTLNAGGLGVRNRVGSADPEKNVFTDGKSPGGFNDFLLFQFSQPVASATASFTEREGFEASQFTLYTPTAGGFAADGGPIDIDGPSTFTFVLDAFGFGAFEDTDHFLVSMLTFEVDDVAPVPLPAGGLLLLLGLGGLAVARRRA